MNTENENLDDDDSERAYMPYDILEEEEEEGESVIIVVSRGAGVVVRQVVDRLSRLAKDRPQMIPTKRAEPEVGVMLDALGRLVAEHEQIGYQQLEKKAEFRQLIADLSRHRWKPRFEGSSHRRNLQHKRRRAKQQD